MAVVSFKKLQKIPGESDKVWSFFADPANLPLITPPYMRFEILSVQDRSPLPSDCPRPAIYPGQVIEYKLYPFPWFRVHWITEISQVCEGQYFVDEQRRGPYRLWHHQHHFRPISGGVEMTDIVHYEVGYGPIGNLANKLFVKRQLEGIFQYRRKRVEELFGVYVIPPA
ncbi:MAG: SRPBCC family protein [Bacteroidetes bacterium]|nr:SRPBCC family protein [Bacteroidota bacterium]